MERSSTNRGGKRERLVRAATTVFARQGFGNTRVADIAAEADVGKGTVYEYFDSKEELFLAVMQSINAAIRNRVQRILDSEDSARGKLTAMMREGARIVIEQRDLQPMNIDFCASSRGTPFEARFSHEVNRLLREYRELITDLIIQGQEAGEFRREVDREGIVVLLVGIFDALGVQHWIDPTIDPVRVIEAFIHTLCNGLCTTPGEPT